MGGVFWRGGSREIVKPTAITGLKMEDTYIHYNVIEIFFMKKSNQGRKMRAFCPLQAPNGISTVM
jgi:chitinase